MGWMSRRLHETLGRLNPRPAQTYEAARAELGGAPWREAPKSTDAWFIMDDEVVAPSAQPRQRALIGGIAVAALLTTLVLIVLVRSPRQAPYAAAVVSATIPAPALAAAGAAPVTVAEPPAEADGRSDRAIAAATMRPKRGHHPSSSHRSHHRSK
jgi:hypothetical protein